MVSYIGVILKIDNIDLFVKRNLKKYVENSLFGVYSLHSDKKYNLKFYIKSFLVLFYFYFLKKIYIPQVEFFITSNCTLKCEQCSNYTPYIQKVNNFELDLNDFKRHINNLIKNVYKLNSLIIIGGEPLLHPNFVDMLEYALSIKKIEKVYIFTNCTIVFSNEQLNVLIKNRNKVHVYLSNYSCNPKIKNILKIDEIKKQLEDNCILYTFDEKFVWAKQEKIEFKNRLNNQDIEVCSSCGVPSVSAINGELHYCPKATAGKLLNVVDYIESDFINLNSEVTKKNIIDFYSNNNFSICKYCSGSKGPMYLIKPAKQLEE